MLLRQEIRNNSSNVDLYGFVFNNPTNAYDLFGLMTDEQYEDLTGPPPPPDRADWDFRGYCRLAVTPTLLKKLIKVPLVTASLRCNFITSCRKNRGQYWKWKGSYYHSRHGYDYDGYSREVLEGQGNELHAKLNGLSLGVDDITPTWVYFYVEKMNELGISPHPTFKIADLAGSALLYSGGGAIGKLGYSAGVMMLGNAISTGHNWQTGLGLSIDTLVGSSEIIGEAKEKCCDPAEDDKRVQDLVSKKL